MDKVKRILAIMLKIFYCEEFYFALICILLLPFGMLAMFSNLVIQKYDDSLVYFINSLLCVLCIFFYLIALLFNKSYRFIVTMPFSYYVIYLLFSSGYHYPITILAFATSLVQWMFVIKDTNQYKHLLLTYIIIYILAVFLQSSGIIPLIPEKISIVSDGITISVLLIATLVLSISLPLLFYLRQNTQRINRKNVENYDFSRREREVLSHLLKGLSNKEIARKLNIAESTVKTFVKRICVKSNTKSRKEILKLFLE